MIVTGKTSIALNEVKPNKNESKNPQGFQATSHMRN